MTVHDFVLHLLPSHSISSKYRFIVSSVLWSVAIILAFVSLSADFGAVIYLFALAICENRSPSLSFSWTSLVGFDLLEVVLVFSFYFSFCRMKPPRSINKS